MTTETNKPVSAKMESSKLESSTDSAVAGSEATSEVKSLRSYRRFSFMLLIYALVIILWGAWVRISGSGDGCGPHWPLCHGQIWLNTSFTDQAKMLIELTHRVKSGLFGILVLIQFFWSRKLFAKTEPSRKAASMTLLFTITEALLGAKLVLLGLVANDSSGLRAFSMSLHLGNTLLLLYCLTACWQSGIKDSLKFLMPEKKILFCHLSLLLIAITGSWAALASTLFPAKSLLEGISADFSPDSHWLLRIRILHPVLAFSLTCICLSILQKYKEGLKNPSLRALASRTQLLIAITVLVGLTTLLSGSPTILKITHLLSADFAWIGLTVFSIKTSRRLES